MGISWLGAADKGIFSAIRLFGVRKITESSERVSAEFSALDSPD